MHIFWASMDGGRLGQALALLDHCYFKNMHCHSRSRSRCIARRLYRINIISVFCPRRQSWPLAIMMQLARACYEAGMGAVLSGMMMRWACAAQD